MIKYFTKWDNIRFMSGNEWKTNFDKELHLAVKAREEANEGRARVCARRAVGILIGEYLSRKGLPDPGPSVYERIRYFTSLRDVDLVIKKNVEVFLLRVTPDHNLPIDVDLIEESRWLEEILL